MPELRNLFSLFFFVLPLVSCCAKKGGVDFVVKGGGTGVTRLPI